MGYVENAHTGCRLLVAGCSLFSDIFGCFVAYVNLLFILRFEEILHYHLEISADLFAKLRIIVNIYSMLRLANVFASVAKI